MAGRARDKELAVPPMDARRAAASGPAFRCFTSSVWSASSCLPRRIFGGARLGGFRPAPHAGNQAASSLAEALGQEALGQAQRFEEFNRRFAFILHDIKNLVSQLSLLARNAERHADNPEFRADMVATLRRSVGKMNELLARLAPHSPVARAADRNAAAAANPHRGDRRQAARPRGQAARRRGVGRWSMPIALEQAVGHLIQNAIDASSGEGR